MNNGNQNAYEYGEVYRNYQGQRESSNDSGSRNYHGSVNPAMCPGPGGYPHPPPVSGYPHQMYYQNAVGGQNVPHSLSNRMPTPQAYGFQQHAIPMMPHPAWSVPPPPPSTVPQSSNNNNNNNNNNNYQDTNAWSQYGSTNPWRQPSVTGDDHSNQQQATDTQRNISPKSTSLSSYPRKPSSPESSSAPSTSAPKRPAGSSGGETEPKDEEKETKKPVPIMVGKRRGGRVLPTGVVKKPRGENTTQGRTDAWGQYMAEVRKYKEQSCEEERKNRPLVK